MNPVGDKIERYLEAGQLAAGDGRVLPPADHSVPRAALGGEASSGNERRVRRADGTEVSVQSAATPLVAADGSRLGVVLTLRDSTERQQAEEERAKLAAIVESSDDAIIGKTLDGIITSWNPGAERLYGYSAEEAIGQSVSLLYPPDHRHELAELLARGDRQRAHLVLCHRRGRRHCAVRGSSAPPDRLRRAQRPGLPHPGLLPLPSRDRRRRGARPIRGGQRLYEPRTRRRLREPCGPAARCARAGGRHHRGRCQYHGA